MESTLESHRQLVRMLQERLAEQEAELAVQRAQPATPNATEGLVSVATDQAPEEKNSTTELALAAARAMGSEVQEDDAKLGDCTVDTEGQLSEALAANVLPA